MFSDSTAISVAGLGKCFHLYEKPRDRLLQMFSFGRRQYYSEFWALRDVSFEVRRGETIGIVGRNGSGKSTLLQMICGTLTPTAGTISTNGRVAALLELGAGFNPEFTGRENVYLNAAILGLSRQETDERFDDIAAFADIGDFIDQPIKIYSSGMYVRLAFAVAINSTPDILIVDEALAVGDVRFQYKCMRRIKDIQNAGSSVLFVSHDVGSIRSLCQRAVWLDNGQLRQIGDVLGVTSRYTEFMYHEDAADTKGDGNTVSEPQELQAGAGSDAAVSGDGLQLHLDSKPASHWGSQTGLIQHAAVHGAAGNKADVFDWGEDVCVRIVFAPPAGAALGNVSVAFSIKNEKGADLLVSSTQEEGIPLSTVAESGNLVAEFRFQNLLVPGKYLLVAALENTATTDAAYFEYLEGAHYFSVVAPTRYMGVFRPPVDITVSDNA